MRDDAALDREIERLQQEALESEVDLTLLRSNLAHPPLERLRRHDRFVASLEALTPRDAARDADERRAADDAR